MGHLVHKTSFVPTEVLLTVNLCYACLKIGILLHNKATYCPIYSDYNRIISLFRLTNQFAIMKPDRNTVMPGTVVICTLAVNTVVLVHNAERAWQSVDVA